MPREQITRLQLRSLKEQTVEKNRLRKIQKYIHEIYDDAIDVAKRGVDTFYNFEIVRSHILFY